MFSDWFAYFWPQILSPMEVNPGMFNLPWFFVLLQPLRLLGASGALIIVEVITLLVVILLACKLRLPFLKTFFVIFSPPVLWCLFMGQIDGLVLAAYLLPSAGALFLTLVKPQILIAYGIEVIWRRPRLMMWVLLLVLSAWLIWGWPLSVQHVPFDGRMADIRSWNWSFWPWGLCLVPLLLIRDLRVGMLVSPFIFPYAGLQSLIGPVLVLAELPWKIFIPVWLLLWVRWAFMVHLF